MSRHDSTKISDVKVLLKMGSDGSGIASIDKTGTLDNVDTYTITLDDGRKTTFTVTNGTSIASIEKTDTQGNVDTYTITLTDGSTSTFTVTNGEGSSASSLPYDNTTSELSATNVQDAIDEIDATVDGHGESIDDIDAEIADMNNILGAKNLCPNTASTITQYGTIYTIGTDGSILVTGSPTTNNGIVIGTATLVAGTYKITTQQGADESATKTPLAIKKASDSSDIARSNQNDGVFTISSAVEVNFIQEAYTGDTALNIRTYPMCRPASIKDESYVPYSMTNNQLTAEVMSLISKFPKLKYVEIDQLSGTSFNATGVCDSIASAIPDSATAFIGTYKNAGQRFIAGFIYRASGNVYQNSIIIGFGNNHICFQMASAKSLLKITTTNA